LGFLKCEKCGGYYELKEAEAIDDFEGCSCGGKFKYVTSIDGLESVKNSDSGDKSICPNCGTENLKNVKFCGSCGTPIKAPIDPDEKKSQSNNSKIDGIKADNQNLNKKSPLIAAALNFIIAGAGFIYIHKYAKAVLSFIIFLIAAIIGFAMGLGWSLSTLALIVVIVWSYNETKKYNKNLT
jgi:hypothetical protein